MANPKIVERSTKELREWLATNDNFLYKTPRRELEVLLQKDRLDDKELVAASIMLGSISGWVIGKGGLAILDRRPGGWEELHLGMDLLSLELRWNYFDTMRRPKDNRLSWIAADSALALTHAIAVGDKENANELADVMTQAVSHGVYGSYTQCGFEPFVINLFQLARGDARRNIGFKPAEFGDRYQRVWTHWDSVDELSKECAKLCDTHVTIASVDDEAWYGQFGIMPFEIYPVEVLAIQRVRKKLGHDVPTCEHDLFKSPLAEAPTEPPRLSDDLSVRVRQRLRKEYEGF